MTGVIARLAQGDSAAPRLDPPTFETFQTRPGNALASALCESWARGEMNGILVLAGPSATGKTHLALAALAALRPQRERGPLRIAAAVCIDDFVTAIRANTVLAYRERIAGLDALVVEHLEDLADKPACRSEVMSLARDLHARGRPVMLTVTRHPPRSQRILRWLRRQPGVLVVALRAARRSPVPAARPPGP